jgi:hypothetical protein
MTAVMTKRAFDTRRRWPTHLFRCLATPHSDVLKHHTAGGTAGGTHVVDWPTVNREHPRWPVSIRLCGNWFEDIGCGARKSRAVPRFDLCGQCAARLGVGKLVCYDDAAVGWCVGASDFAAIWTVPAPRLTAPEIP